MIESIEQLHDHADPGTLRPQVTRAARGALTVPRRGRLCALWVFASQNPTIGSSGLAKRVEEDGYYVYMQPFIEAIPRAGKDLPPISDVCLHLPYGGLIGSDMPFESQLIWSRFSRTRRSVPWLCDRIQEASEFRMIPTVYLGGLYRSWWDGLHWSLFQDGVMRSIDQLWNVTSGIPQCHIAGDTWGVKGVRSREFAAACLLWRGGFKVGVCIFLLV